MLALWDYSVNWLLARKNTHVWPVNAPLTNLKFAKWRLCHWFKKWKSHWFWSSTWKKMREFEEWLILHQFFWELFCLHLLETEHWKNIAGILNPVGCLATFLDIIWHCWLDWFLKTPSFLGFGDNTLLCLFPASLFWSSTVEIPFYKPFPPIYSLKAHVLPPLAAFFSQSTQKSLGDLFSLF